MVCQEQENQHRTEVHEIHRRMEKPTTVQDSYAAHPGTTIPVWSRTDGDRWIDTHFILLLRGREN